MPFVFSFVINFGLDVSPVFAKADLVLELHVDTIFNITKLTSSIVVSRSFQYASRHGSFGKFFLVLDFEWSVISQPKIPVLYFNEITEKEFPRKRQTQHSVVEHFEGDSERNITPFFDLIRLGHLDPLLVSTGEFDVKSAVWVLGRPDFEFENGYEGFFYLSFAF